MHSSPPASEELEHEDAKGPVVGRQVVTLREEVQYAMDNPDTTHQEHAQHFMTGTLHNLYYKYIARRALITRQMIIIAGASLSE